MTKRTEPGDCFDVSGMQQPIDHVENEQRLHAVIRKAFPRFGEGDVAEPARMPDEAAILRIVHRRRLLRPTGFGKRGGESREDRGQRSEDRRQRSDVR